jgi:hypothetical protein
METTRQKTRKTRRVRWTVLAGGLALALSAVVAVVTAGAVRPAQRQRTEAAPTVNAGAAASGTSTTASKASTTASTAASTTSPANTAANTAASTATNTAASHYLYLYHHYADFTAAQCRLLPTAYVGGCLTGERFQAEYPPHDSIAKRKALFVLYEQGVEFSQTGCAELPTDSVAMCVWRWQKTWPKVKESPCTSYCGNVPPPEYRVTGPKFPSSTSTGATTGAVTGATSSVPPTTPPTTSPTTSPTTPAPPTTPSTPDLTTECFTLMTTQLCGDAFITHTVVQPLPSTVGGALADCASGWLVSPVGCMWANDIAAPTNVPFGNAPRGEYYAWLASGDLYVCPDTGAPTAAAGCSYLYKTTPSSGFHMSSFFSPAALAKAEGCPAPLQGTVTASGRIALTVGLGLPGGGWKAVPFIIDTGSPVMIVHSTYLAGTAWQPDGVVGTLLLPFVEGGARLPYTQENGPLALLDNGRWVLLSTDAQAQVVSVPGVPFDNVLGMDIIQSSGGLRLQVHGSKWAITSNCQ